MRMVIVVGIGAGDPEQLTLQAVRRVNEIDVFFFLDKGDVKHDLVDARQMILDRYVERTDYRVITMPDVDRDRTSADYVGAVAEWRTRRADLYERLIGTLGDDQIGGILAWGDPALYDNTLSVLDHVLARGNLTFSYEVAPGISSISALAAAHRTSLNRIGRPFQITTGRRLASDGFPPGVDDVVVMLDSRCTFTELADQDVHIYWGAYLGTSDEITVAGPLSDVADEIQHIRAEAAARKGWVMDTYLLRRHLD